MAVAVNVRGDFKQVIRMLGGLKPKVRKAASQSLNRARQRTQTRIARTLARRVNMPQKVIRRRMRFKAAKPEFLITQIQGWWMPVSLIRLGRARETKTGASVRGRKILGGFIERSRFGHHMVLKRAPGARRLPIHEQKEPIESEADRTARIMIKRVGSREFRREFERNLTRMLRR